MSTLAGLNALGEISGASLDSLTELATHTFNVPVAFVSLLQIDRQRLVSRRGLAMSQTHIRDSICASTIGSAETLVIDDLLQHPRHASNPLVAGEPHLRFYAGAPLVARNGVAIGAFCVMDDAPRTLSEAERRQLETLARAAMNELELRAMSGRSDPVSGLPDRQQFMLDHDALAEREPGTFMHAVLVDVFDTAISTEAGQVLGMAPLETLIRRTGVRLKVALDGLAQVYHVGVARFAFVLELEQASAVEALLAELQARVTRPMMAAEVPMSPGFHAGVCELTLGQHSAGEVIRRLLVGLSAAVSARAPFRWYSQGHDASTRRGYRLATDGRTALQQDEFHLVYQPRFRARDLQPVAAEVLIRWNHPQLGPVSPAEFIPVFERTALMHGITDWVVDRALDQLARWHADGLLLNLSINYSARDMAREGAAERLIAGIDRRGLACTQVEVEITESQWLRADSQQGVQLKRMADAGIRVAVDDFGSGYSNFGYLTELPISTLKLDKSLIDRLCLDNRSSVKVEAIIGLAHRLGYSVVAEGAESADQVSRLRALGCDEIQGFALARPMDPDQLFTGHSRPLLGAHLAG
ncbi:MULTISPECIES: EAL domain-containing protein [unclassified Stenotrophomonas maltophilia group]|uniref:EAL domain-containing protein n=1 Tax=unclassified Stenotrophomonas maltophilia group TaxID=2961925 RepID=UPI000D542687|nr:MULTISPECIES: EAL domain-containing protein [unclassified Stenotrophomonas maltophilia group]AWH29554.1 sensor domain-containing phosphodiesterase [Stenotrophomonas sp. YAU14A_MKIMI4_1]AWH33548.1 sensor domain-containing phosphodiesterase [Stenotrophomonas sp. SAU14A_NAIMI4_8]